MANLLNHPETREKFPNTPVSEVLSVVQDPAVTACHEIAIVGSSIVYLAKERAIQIDQENLGLPVRVWKKGNEMETVIT